MIFLEYTLNWVTVQTQRLERLHIYHFEIPRKRSKEQKRVRLEQPSFAKI